MRVFHVGPFVSDPDPGCGSLKIFWIAYSKKWAFGLAGTTFFGGQRGVGVVNKGPPTRQHRERLARAFRGVAELTTLQHAGAFC